MGDGQTESGIGHCIYCNGTGRITVEDERASIDPTAMYGVSIPDGVLKELEKLYGQRATGNNFFIDQITITLTTEHFLSRRNLVMQVETKGMGRHHSYQVPIIMDALLSEFDRYMQIFFIEVSHQLKAQIKRQLGVDVNEKTNK